MTTLPSYIISADLGQVNDPTAIAVLSRREEATGRTEEVESLAHWFDWKHREEPAPRHYTRAQIAGVYDVIHLERLPLGTPYTDLPGKLQKIDAQIRKQWMATLWELEQEDSRNGRPWRRQYGPESAVIDLVIDQTGVGRPVVDLLRERGVRPVAITIHGGDQVIAVDEDSFRVPKRDLLGAVQAALQNRRLRASDRLPDWPVLRAELQAFKAKISLSGHDSYGGGGGADDWREGGSHDDLVLAVAMGLWFGEQVAAGLVPA